MSSKQRAAEMLFLCNNHLIYQEQFMNQEKVHDSDIPAILLVDDEDRFRKTLKKRFKDRGIHISDAASGYEALEMIREQPWDIVVLDVKMPGMSGLDALKEIKKIAPEIEVILLTGHASVEIAADGMKLGASDYLYKPCDIEDLIDKIDSSFEAKKAKTGENTKKG